MTPATIIDVLDNSLDGDITREAVMLLSEDQLDDLVIEIARFYREQPVSLPDAPALRVTPGTMHMEGWLTVAPAETQTNLLLYADELAYMCSLSDFAAGEAERMSEYSNSQRKVWQEDRTPRYRLWLAEFVEDYGRLSEVVRRGWIKPMPRSSFLSLAGASTTEKARAREDTFDVLERCQDVASALVLANGGGIALDRELSRLATKISGDFVTASTYGSRYVPTLYDDARVYWRGVERLVATLVAHGVDMRVCQALATTELPQFAGLSQLDLIAIREDSAAFNAWRATLRDAVRLVEASTVDVEGFEGEFNEVLTDRIAVATDALARDVSKITSLRRIVQTRGIDAGISAMAAGGGAALVGAAVTPAALAGVAGGAGLRIIYDVIFKQRADRPRSVLLRLAQKQ